jgi:hypothetical protein
MTKVGNIFKFAPPESWDESRDGNRYTFRGPNKEELIVSAAIVHGTGTGTDLQAVQEKLFQNARDAVKMAAEHPDLAITRPFQKESVTKAECWTIHARTHMGDVLFYQAVFPARRGESAFDATV